MTVEKGVFPDKLKLARITLMYKDEYSSNVSNYRPVSVLICFPKILERKMYNRLYKYLIENNILYSQQFGFQNCHLNDHAIIQLVDQMTESFEKINIHLVYSLTYRVCLTLCRPLLSSKKALRYHSYFFYM